MTKTFLKLGGAALTVALLTATAVQSRTAIEATIRQAESDAKAAAAALAKHNPDAAIRLAEHAVALRPQDATYRMLLGKSYLAAGRFVSARQAYADALSLDGGQPGALNYALATTATGDFAGAQEILAANAAAIAPADRGLALALAGNPAAGVEILTAAVRLPDASAKIRQNLALAFALAGRWTDARQMALADLSPADADARIVQWAAFSRPAAASDQVASLLGVTAVADDGQPAQLALVSAPTQLAQVAPASAVATAPVVAAQDWHPDVALAAVAPAAPVATPAAITTPAVAAASQLGAVTFGDRHEVAQVLPAVSTDVAAPLRAARTTTVVKPMASTPGNFYVQLGAYNSVAMAKWGWGKVRAHHAVLAGKTPYTMPIGNGLTRVSVGGLARADANALCRTIRASRGICFVRAGAGDRVASWAPRGTQLASR